MRQNLMPTDLPFVEEEELEVPTARINFHKNGYRVQSYISKALSSHVPSTKRFVFGLSTCYRHVFYS